MTIIKLNRARASLEELPSVQHLDDGDRADMSSWGLLPSDLLQQVRTFLLVEGQHEVEVLQGMMGPDLRRWGVEILPLDKGSSLKNVTAASVLFRFSDAPVVAMLDALPGNRLHAIWQETTRILKHSGIQAAIDHLGHAMADMPSPEGPWMRRFLTTALTENRHHRVRPWALPAADVLEYLPAAAFIPGAKNWTDLKRMATRNAGRPITGTELKKWMAKQGADLSERAVRDIAAQIPMPADIRALREGLAGPRRIASSSLRGPARGVGDSSGPRYELLA